MFKARTIIICMLLSLLLSCTNTSGQPDNNTVNIYMFYGQGCAHCTKMLTFFDSIKDKYPQMNVTKKEIYFDKDNAKLLEEFCRKCNTTLEGVPTVFIDGKSYVGFSNVLAQIIETKIKDCIEYGGCSDLGNDSCEQHSTDSSPLTHEKDYSTIGWLFIGVVVLILLYYLLFNK
ncbi:MAG: hypothetical protein KAR87_03015 [Candidatus Aenigmarchaeota archaeon]|nr:hypothetical protein [Candidatus Aenigmarchaeota archaeon]